MEAWPLEPGSTSLCFLHHGSPVVPIPSRISPSPLAASSDRSFLLASLRMHMPQQLPHACFYLARPAATARACPFARVSDRLLSHFYCHSNSIPTLLHGSAHRHPFARAALHLLTCLLRARRLQEPRPCRSRPPRFVCGRLRGPSAGTWIRGECEDNDSVECAAHALDVDVGADRRTTRRERQREAEQRSAAQPALWRLCDAHSTTRQWIHVE
jgi:hypothetical protein